MKPIRCPKCENSLSHRKKKLFCRKCGYTIRSKKGIFKIPPTKLGILKGYLIEG